MFGTEVSLCMSAHKQLLGLTACVLRVHESVCSTEQCVCVHVLSPASTLCHTQQLSLNKLRNCDRIEMAAPVP